MTQFGWTRSTMEDVAKVDTKYRPLTFPKSDGKSFAFGVAFNKKASCDSFRWVDANSSMTDGTETSESSLHSSLDQREGPDTPFPEELHSIEAAYSDAVLGSSAYARLAGTGKGAIDYLVRSKVVTIGRTGCGADCQLRSDTRTVSRHHATIYWVSESDSWAITCFSRSNALTVDGAPVLANAPPMPLRSRNLIEIGDAAFFFLAAVEPNVRTGNIDFLESQILKLRSANKSNIGSQDLDDRSVKRPRRTSSNEIARSRQRLHRKRSVDTAEDNTRSYSSDEYHNDELPFGTVHLESDPDRLCNEDPENDSARQATSSRPEDAPRGRRTVETSCTGLKASVKRKHDIGSDEADPRAFEKSERRLKKSRKAEKKKKKGKKRRSDKIRRVEGNDENIEFVEPEELEEDDDGLTGGLDLDTVDDGFDVAPVPSLHDYKARSALGSTRVQGSSKCREEWNKKERADFGRAIFAVGVDSIYDARGNRVSYDWARFRGIARLEKKSDAMLTDYYVRMIADVEYLLEEEAREKRAKGPRTKHKPGCDCVVCENTRKSRRKKEEEIAERDKAAADGDVEAIGTNFADTDGQLEDGSASAMLDGNANHGVDRVIGLVTAQKLRVRMGIHEAARQVESIAGQNVMRKLRGQSRSVAANGELPGWWVNGVHDHALMVGVGRFGVGQWSDIWADIHNPEFVRARVEEGEDIEWPTTQVAMKRLREISSSINAELRRVAKKRAKGVSGVSPSKAPGLSSRKQRSAVEGATKATRRTPSKRRAGLLTGEGRVNGQPPDFAETTHRGEFEGEDDEDIDIELGDGDSLVMDDDDDDNDDDGADDAFEKDEETRHNLENAPEGGYDEEEEEIEMELEEEEGEEDDDSDPNTASDSD
jgi:pSer/pThr/pTyr-binding forkhead associated (FHA) protein